MSATPGPGPEQEPAEGTVAYLTKRFPRLSETFILDEILGLEAAGVPLRLYSIADPLEDHVQPDVARVASPIAYLRHHGLRGALRDLGAVLAAHVSLVASRPRRYAAVVGEVLRSNDRRTAARHFVYAGRLAVSVERDHARHLHAAFAHTPASIVRYTHLLTGLPFSFGAHAKDLYLSDPVNLATRTTEARFVVVCSQSAARALAELAGPRARIVLAYHGVDSNRFAPPEIHDPGTGALRILAVGRLVAKKGYPVLLQAVSHLAAEGIPVRCEIIGGGELADKLTAHLQRLDLAGIVTLSGARTHQQIAQAYRHADVFVQASVVLPDGDRDGIPNSLLEAMASGLAVVASRVAGIPEIVTDALTGLLVAPADADALAAALRRLAHDSTLRAALGAAARGHVATHLDRHVCAQQTAALFEASTALAPQLR
jgi:glycosyltransferase involved in cell wall biosynthesis